MTKHEKAKQVLEAFIESYSMEGTCGAFFVDPEMDVHSNYNIHVVFNIDWIKNQEARPHLVAKKLRDNFKQEIKNYTGIDVYVSSSSTNCNNLDKLSESMAPHVKRRLSNVKILDELTTILDYEINIENFDNASDAVEELCDMLNERILDEIWETTNRKVSLAEKDKLYWHIYDRFNKFITHRYNESKEMNESKKKYIVTEQQYNLMKEYFDPLYYLKKVMNNAPKYIRNPDTLKYDVAFQKVVDVIFKYTMKDAPVDNLKGLEVIKVTHQGWGGNMNDDTKGSHPECHTEWIVVAHSVLPKWFNPDDDTYKSQMENFKKEFASIAHMMGLSSSSPMSQEGYPFDKVRFQIYNS
jgi:hypothetical protein